MQEVDPEYYEGKKKELLSKGFSFVDDIYSSTEVEEISLHITKACREQKLLNQSSDLFAIRQLFQKIPGLINTIFNEHLQSVLRTLLGEKYFAVKSIYFDKPKTSNWFVSYHQDLTISVDKIVELNGFQFWTTKQNQYAVQPSLGVLENLVTVRIHLDDTDENNGALKVIPGSHLKSIYRPETIDWKVEQEVNCIVPKGGVMLMKPLLLHSSGRTVNNKQRRVIHIEFSTQELPTELNWSERIDLNRCS